MKIIRRRDGVSGWAVQMVIPFELNGLSYGTGSYIVEMPGEYRRHAVTPGAFDALYRPFGIVVK
jgi:hypothetical protein